MKKTICNKVYDTEASTLIKKCTVGAFGDPAGYEESLYQTADGAYFVYACGGEASPYAEAKITRLAKTKVAEWEKAHA